MDRQQESRESDKMMKMVNNLLFKKLGPGPYYLKGETSMRRLNNMRANLMTPKTKWMLRVNKIK